MTRTMVAAIAALALAHAGEALATVALFDEGHGQRWPMSSSPYFSDAWDLLIANGHDLRVLNEPISASSLDGIDLLVTGTIEAMYVPAELDALHAFVASGGTVLVTHDGGGSADAFTSSLNDFLAPYGMTLAATCSHGDGLYVEGFQAHCITAGIAALQLDYVRTLSAIGSPAQDLTVGSDEVLAVYDDPSGGAIVVLPDDNAWADTDLPSDAYLTDYDNATFLLNILDCSLRPTPTTSTSWGATKARYR